MSYLPSMNKYTLHEKCLEIGGNTIAAVVEEVDLVRLFQGQGA